MTTRNDPRREVGSWVETKATAVTCEAECRRRYGALWNSKMVQGVISEVLVTPGFRTNRSTTNIKAQYYLGGGTFRVKTLNIRRVKLFAPSALNITNRNCEISNLDQASLSLLPREEAHSDYPKETQTPIPYTPIPPIPMDIHPGLAQVTGNNNGDENTGLDSEDQPTDRDVAPDADAHGTFWYNDSNATKCQMNGEVSFRPWGVKNTVGEIFGQGTDSRRSVSCLDYFLMMFPTTTLNTMSDETSKVLSSMGQKEISNGEMLKFFGVLILATRFEFSARASLWSTRSTSKYVPAPAFGRTGMSRERFDKVWQCLRWTKRADHLSAEMGNESVRWTMVDGFVQQFNAHRENRFRPSDLLCVDESISRWYGQGGHWINHGLPMYVAIDRKPENGCEIHNTACGRSSIMLRLRLVKTAAEEALNGERHRETLHGTMILKYLVQPWTMSDRIVCADSYFASVVAAEELMRVGLRFIGVIKTATRKQKDGTETNYLLQGQCCVCTQKTTSCCSQCLDESIGGKEVWICGTKKGKMCYVRHMHNVHGL